MPNITIDLKNLKEIKETIIILQDIFNDSRFPEELYVEYTQRFNKIWDKNSMTKEEKINKVEESMSKKNNDEFTDAITYDYDGLPILNYKRFTEND